MKNFILLACFAVCTVLYSSNLSTVSDDVDQTTSITSNLRIPERVEDLNQRPPLPRCPECRRIPGSNRGECRRTIRRPGQPPRQVVTACRL